MGGRAVSLEASAASAPWRTTTFTFVSQPKP
jgi:hypothetical protein